MKRWWDSQSHTDKVAMLVGFSIGFFGALYFTREK